MVRPKERRIPQGGPTTYPGDIESAWVDSNPPELEQYRGKIVAILGAKVVLSADSSKQLFDAYDASGLVDALIIRIPSEPTDDYFIG